MTDAPARRARPRSFFEVALALLGLSAIALVVGVAVYMRMIRYERVAALHLPPDTELAARVDVENVVMFEPARRHLLPLLDELLPPQRPGLGPRRERLLREAKLDFVVDLREIVVGRGRGPRDVVVLLGGRFPRQGVVAGIARALGEEGNAWELSADARTLTGPSGVSIAQAEDGTLILASDRERALAALPRSITHERLGLTLEGAGALAGQGPALDSWLARVAELAPGLAASGRVERVTGTLLATPAPRLRLVVRYAAGTDVESATGQLRKALGSLAEPASAWSPVAGEKSALSRAEVASQAAGIVEVVLPGQAEDLDQAAAGLARAVRAALVPAARRP